MFIPLCWSAAKSSKLGSGDFGPLQLLNQYWTMIEITRYWSILDHWIVLLAIFVVLIIFFARLGKSFLRQTLRLSPTHTANPTISSEKVTQSVENPILSGYEKGSQLIDLGPDKTQVLNPSLSIGSDIQQFEDFILFDYHDDYFTHLVHHNMPLPLQSLPNTPSTPSCTPSPSSQSSSNTSSPTRPPKQHLTSDIVNQIPSSLSRIQEYMEQDEDFERGALGWPSRRRKLWSDELLLDPMMLELLEMEQTFW